MKMHLMITWALLLASTPIHAASRTIVGVWAPDPAACTPVGGMIEIGPMTLTGDDLACHFEHVARSGDVVTWHGRCSRGGVSRPTTVVAITTGASLHVSADKTEIGIYRRCSGELSNEREPKPKPMSDPWDADRWRADVDATRDGHALHATLIGTATKTERGDSVEVTCTDRGPTGKTAIVRHHAWALSRQGDWEGDAGPLGQFGSDRTTLRWFGPTPCAAGPITWKRM